ncbi:MAG TPA: hypothetical protein VF773_10780 [Verrucomicrobiae bacterium]
MTSAYEIYSGYFGKKIRVLKALDRNLVETIDQTTKRLLGEHGLREDTEQTRAEFLRRIESRRASEEGEEFFQAIRRGWCFGAQSFQQQVVALVESQGKEAPMEVRAETATLCAERIIAEELTARGRTTGQLTRRRRNDPAKLAIATRLRNETTLTVKQISQRLHLGTPKSAKTNLHHHQRVRPGTPKVAAPQREFAGI